MTANNCDTNQTLLPIPDALELLLSHAEAITETENIDIINANGRVLAENLSSSINVPPTDNSAMDGYAVRSSDFSTDKEVTLHISQRICAGDIGEALADNTVARIFTGAAIPAGADAVLMQEDCMVDGSNITSKGSISTGTNIRNAGEDIRTGSTILKTGHKLKPQDLGLAASVGISTVSVYRRLRVGVFFTGDELQEPGTPLKDGKIYNSNRYTLRGLLETLNCEILDLGIVNDTLEATRNAMSKAADKTDLVMTSGGVSVGEEDHVRIALEQLGKLKMWRINIKPGKPFVFGTIGNTPFLGMPGNPVSVFATFCIFARPFILSKQSINNIRVNSFKVAAAFNWKKKGNRNEYVRARMDLDETGTGKISVYPYQGSGILSSVSWANGLAFIPAKTTVTEGELVEFTPFGELGLV